jgi:hypothetical protein
MAAIMTGGRCMVMTSFCLVTGPVITAANKLVVRTGETSPTANKLVGRRTGARTVLHGNQQLRGKSNKKIDLTLNGLGAAGLMALFIIHLLIRSGD